MELVPSNIKNVLRIGGVNFNKFINTKVNRHEDQKIEKEKKFRANNVVFYCHNVPSLEAFPCIINNFIMFPMAPDRCCLFTYIQRWFAYMFVSSGSRF